MDHHARLSWEDKAIYRVLQWRLLVCEKLDLSQRPEYVMMASPQRRQPRLDESVPAVIDGFEILPTGMALASIELMQSGAGRRAVITGLTGERGRIAGRGQALGGSSEGTTHSRGLE